MRCALSMKRESMKIYTQRLEQIPSDSAVHSTVETVQLNFDTRQKSRFRATLNSGTDIGVDMRVDYLAPGRGKYFIARAETLRLGRKGCTMRMTMVNDEDKAIATAIASYAY